MTMKLDEAVFRTERLVVTGREVNPCGLIDNTDQNMKMLQFNNGY